MSLTSSKVTYIFSDGNHVHGLIVFRELEIDNCDLTAYYSYDIRLVEDVSSLILL